jgi:hypothetical protein
MLKRSILMLKLGCFKKVKKNFNELRNLKKSKKKSHQKIVQIPCKQRQCICDANK